MTNEIHVKAEDYILIANYYLSEIKNAKDIMVEEFKNQVNEGERKSVIIDGLDIGSVTLSKPKASFVVTDPKLFLEWVDVNYPDRIREKKTVDIEQLPEVHQKLIEDNFPELIETERDVEDGFEGKVLGYMNRYKSEADENGLIVEGVGVKRENARVTPRFTTEKQGFDTVQIGKHNLEALIDENSRFVEPLIGIEE